MALEEVAVEAAKPLIGVFLDFHAADDERRRRPDDVGHLPRFDAAADAVHALSALTAYAHWRDRDPGAVPLLEVDEHGGPAGGEPGAGRASRRVAS